MADTTNAAAASGDAGTAATPAPLVVPSTRSIKSATSFLHRGMLVSFRDITYTVINSANKKEEIQLLTNISAYARPGELVALMGPSGSGKSTLLDVLAGRKTVGRIDGTLTYEGQRPTQRFLRRYTGYVEQQDTLVPILTVAEMLRYQAELKMDESVSNEVKDKVVDDVIEALALESCRNTLIGSSMARGISGGQAKRVNIGIALVTNPRVLYLDEPTTGLDSFTANEVVETLKTMAAANLTVIATIHSPTGYAFAQFDRLLLLLRGRTVYFGRNGDAAIEYMHEAAADIATTVKFDKHAPADWLTDVTVVADREGLHGKLAEAYSASSARAHADQELDSQLAAATRSLSRQDSEALATKRATVTSSRHALWTLMKYRMRRDYTSAEFYLSRAAPWIVITFVLMTLFWNIGENISQLTYPNVAAIVYYWAIAPAFTAASFVPQIMLSRPLYFRERNDGLYRPITYLIYLIIDEAAVGLVVTLGAALMMWYGLGLQGSVVLFWLGTYVGFLNGLTSAYFITALSPNIDVGNAVVPIFGVISMFFSNFLIRWADIGWYYRWICYLIPGYWAVASQFNNYFDGDRDIILFNNQTVTQYYDIDYMSAWGFWGVQACFVPFFGFLAWLALAYKSYVKR